MSDSIVSALSSVDCTVLMGIDGMVDEVWELLDSRTAPDGYVKMTRMMEFGGAITERGTGGLAKERILKRRSSGGFVCNTGRATATLGAATTMLGTFGEGGMDSVFDEFNGLAELVSVGNPAQILVLEFIDGKIFLPSLNELVNLRWDGLLERLGEERLRRLCDVDIVGMGYWSNMYDFERIMTNLACDYLQNGRTRRIFHDFANLNKRSPQALEEAIAVLGRLNDRMPMTLSLNEHEGAILAHGMGVDYPGRANDKTTVDAVLSAVVKMRERAGIDELIIHTSYFAVIATAKEGAAFAMQDYCETPVKTTGAGDTFNGGYMFASMAGISPWERLTAANATTRYYVTNGKPPTVAQLIEQMQRSVKE